MSSPHHDALEEARARLAAAERATATGDAAQLGAAAAHADAAIALLTSVINSFADGGAETGRLLASAWLRRGQAHERRRNADAAAEALRSYDQAVALLRDTPEDAEQQVRRDLAIALINRGNAQQQTGGADSHPGAVKSYDEAITLLRMLPLDAVPALRNSLGAAWLNRGGAFERLGTPESAAEAARSFAEAGAVLRTLPLDDQPSYRINLAAAGMNRARVLLRTNDAASAPEARTAALEALAFVTPLAHDLPAAAEVSLQARHLACRALSDLLAAGPRENVPPAAELFAEATDTVDDGLALARHWAARSAPVPPKFVAELFRFGALIYAAHQPHFLAEFVLENLDPENAPGAPAPHPALHAVGSEVIGRVLHDYERPRLLTSDQPDLERQAQTLRDLRAAAARLEALRPKSSDRPAGV